MEPATASMIEYLSTFARVAVHTYIICTYTYVYGVQKGVRS